MTSFKEDYAKFRQLDAEILAISADSIPSHRKFSEKLGGLPYPMLSDENATIIRAYGVLNDKGTGAMRSVFVLDREGRIIHANKQYSVSNPAHYQAIFDALAS